MMTARLHGVGIDLLKLSRVKKFLKINGLKKTSTLLNPGELQQSRKAKNRILDFAKRFAAKEAYFKAWGGAWMGTRGFAALKVKLKSGAQFEVIPSDNYFPHFKPASGTFFRMDDFVGAQVIIWETA